jgi:tRNA (cmo5U34)-methyltransferase
VVSQYHFTPERYLALIKEDLPAYDELQDAVAAATEGVDARRVLDLGVGTGETARRVLLLHPGATLVAIDSSAEMVAAATVGGDLRVARLEDELPRGPFDLVVSALAVHHLPADGKRDLFMRVARELRPGGRFVLGDLVAVDEHVTPWTPGYDFPDPLDDLVAWLGEAGFATNVTWSRHDLAVVAADRRR